MGKKYNREYAILKARELAEELKKNKLNVLNVFLFGSFADKSKTDFEWSDIDIAIISNDFSGSRFDDNLFLIPISLKIDPRIETDPFTSEDFDNSPFAKDEIMTKERKSIFDLVVVSAFQIYFSFH